MAILETSCCSAFIGNGHVEEESQMKDGEGYLAISMIYFFIAWAHWKFARHADEDRERNAPKSGSAEEE
jgi:hypothetical protein